MGELDNIKMESRRDWEPSVELKLPPLPGTVADVTNLMAENADPPDTPKLAAIIKSDPVVGTAVLRRINSAFYGLRTRIGEIEKACQMLGFEEVCDIVLATGMMQIGDVFEKESHQDIFERIVELSVGSAAFNKKIAEAFEVPQKGLAFTTGLLHTIGRMVLLYNRPGEYESLWYTTKQGRPPTPTSEQIIFGVDHTELAVRVGKEWNLPEETVVVIRHYLTPGHAKKPHLRVLALSLAVASAAADHYCLGSDGDGSDFTPPAAIYALARAFEVKPEKVLKRIRDDQEEVRQFVHSMVDPQIEKK